MITLSIPRWPGMVGGLRPTGRRCTSSRRQRRSSFRLTPCSSSPATRGDEQVPHPLDRRAHCYRTLSCAPTSYALTLRRGQMRSSHPTSYASRTPPTLYRDFTHEAWGRLRADTPLTLSEADLTQLRGLNERVSLDEVVEIYLPLSRLLNLYVAATQELYRATATFLGSDAAKVPYVIGMAGSVAVGKSTTARILQALLARWPHHPKVDLVTTDGFLYPNRVLAERGLMGRKGFPESYDLRALIRFLADVKAGVPEVSAPLYSHLAYDIIDGEAQVVNRPDVVIVEGLNV